MNTTLDPTMIEKPLVRCSDCDEEVSNYNVFLSPTGDEEVICWRCLAREEKGFNATPGFQRLGRRGVIPR
ncbi:MAG TPA: hypothetical protein PKA82_07355 [Pyrinomonadaceae bacterium]|nr:hypothetical protein [Pyrinomonadaceae bacterium]